VCNATLILALGEVFGAVTSQLAADVVPHEFQAADALPFTVSDFIEVPSQLLRAGRFSRFSPAHVGSFGLPCRFSTFLAEDKMPVAPAVILAVVGVVLTLFGWWKRRKLHASMSWPQVPGTIIGAGIEVSRNVRDDDGGYSASYTPKVQYRYVAEGVTIVGSRIAHVERGYDSHLNAEAELALYPVDSPVVVYFNPQKPSEAVLVRKAPGAIIFLCAGIIILVVDVVAVLKR
jgi:hypothetical protein